MSTVNDIQKSLRSKGVSFEASMKKHALELRLKASEYKPEQITRQEAEKLTVPILKEILTIRGQSVKGLKKKEDILNAVVQLNPTLTLQEKQKREEISEKFGTIPLDALRLAMERMSIPDQMKFAIASQDREKIRELQAKRMDLPDKVEIYHLNPMDFSLRSPPQKTDILRFENSTRQEIAKALGSSLYDNLTWKMSNSFISLERKIVQYLEDENYIAQFVITPKKSKIGAIITHHLLTSSDSSRDKIINIKFRTPFSSLDTNVLLEGLNYVRIAIHWIETYVGYRMIDKNQRKNPIELSLHYEDVPVEIVKDQDKILKYRKLIIQELKKLV